MDDMFKNDIDYIFGKPEKFKLDVDPIKELDAKVIKKTRDAERDPLVQSLEESTHLSNTAKEKLISLAELYMKDMSKNLLLDQFELTEKYNTTNPDDWAMFLNDRVVYTYIKKHKNTLLKSRAETNLADPYAKNKRDNLNLISKIEEQEKNDRQAIVIIRIPDKYSEENS